MTTGLIAVLFAAVLGAVDFIWGVPAVQPEATVLETKAACHERGRYIGWPTLTRLRSGELVVTFSGDRINHLCPFGKVQAVRSRDEGATWSAPETWIDGALDDRDAGLTELPDGTFVLTWFTYMVARNVAVPEWKAHVDAIPKETVEREFGFFTARSTDGGRTWEERVRTRGTAPHGGILLKDGRLLTATSLRDFDYAREIGGVILEVSEDGARSWKTLAEIPIPADVVYPPRFCEPHVAELPDGKLVVLVRDELEGHPMWQSTSTDGGRTWSPIRKSGFTGLPPHLRVLPDGRLLCTYASRQPGDFGIRARVSADGGETWDAAGEIRLAAANDSDIGYPTTLALKDGSLLTAYYMRERFGQGTSLMTTRWRLGRTGVTSVPPDCPQRSFRLTDGSVVAGRRVTRPAPALFGARDVVTLDWDQFAPCEADFAPDPAAADGIAVCDPLRKVVFPFVLSVNNRDEGSRVERVFGEHSGDFPKDDGRYHLVRVGTLEIKGRPTVKLGSSGRFRAELEALAENPLREVWLSVRNRDGRLYFDRIHLVRPELCEEPATPAVSAAKGRGSVELGPCFRDGCVLQRDLPVCIWGRAEPGAAVEVAFAGQKKRTSADADGRWRVRLDPLPASATPRDLVVTSASGQAVVHDVVVGEVWLAAGQSNMELPLWSNNPHRRDRDGLLVARLTDKPQVRLFKVPTCVSSVPRETAGGAWRHAVPDETIRGEEWAPGAIAWYFATHLEDALRVPVGIVEADVGGTDIDAWTPLSAVAGKPELAYDGKLHGAAGGEKQLPERLWNGMVAPLTNMTFRGVLWYQGCQNILEPQRYAAKMRALYDGWSAAFGKPDLPFYFAQLSSFGDENCGDIAVMEAQQRFAEDEPRVGMAVTCDRGNFHDCHPNEKEVVARRLLAYALKRQYGWSHLRPEPPVVTCFEKAGNAVVLRFDDRGRSWYQYRDDFGVASGIELCGADGTWHPATIAELKVKTFEQYGSRGVIVTTNRLTVSSSAVDDPKGVRYLYGGDRRSTLYCSESNLPLGPFMHMFGKALD